ncbi:hypothetical protein P872_23870 [Rhodonellum psychrophilum GCM71 = DSM 17998]|uniref:DUF4221 domain-containing protein n=3 Tax=Cytophagaceae TaxID=89373 RepID=U5BVS7_9BACT|nr:hypothetical protein P872_23870 [Rhodonellum psychrophilum GCM71 = DSM 17998]SDZ12175.1 protein of unknown function [Rhodonellum ikkaensis]
MSFFMKNVFSPAILACILISCTSNKLEDSDRVAHQGPALELAGSMMLHLDEYSTYEFFSHQVVNENGRELLCVLNKQNKSFDTYDLESGNLSKRFPIPSEGPYGISDPYAFLMAGRDSIFVFNQNSFKNTQLLNNEGALQASLTPDNMMTYKYGLNHYSLPNISSQLVGNKIYYGVVGFFDTSDPENFQNDMKLSGVYDLGTNHLEEMESFTFPKSYTNKGWSTYHAMFSWIKNNENDWVVSFHASDSLFVYDLDFQLKKSFSAKSQYVKEILPMKRNLDSEEHLRHAVQSGQYRRLLYDGYRACYYRIVVHPREFNQNEDKNSIAFNRSPFSIIKLNADMEVVSETRFQGSIYSIFTAFVSERGLCIPRTNYWNNEIEEEKIQIDIFI